MEGLSSVIVQQVCNFSQIQNQIVRFRSAP